MAIDGQKVKAKAIEFVTSRIRGAADFGRMLGTAALAAPAYLKTHGPLLFNPLKLYDLYRMGGHTQGVDATWHKGLSAGVAAMPLTVAATATLLAFTAPAALPVFLMMALAPFPILLKLNYDVKEAEKERITRRNAAGQDVTGTRREIFTLDKAQDKITRLTAAFNGAAVDAGTRARIEKTLAAVEAVRKNVAVAGEGQEYRFVNVPAPSAEPPAQDVLKKGAGRLTRLMKPLRW